MLEHTQALIKELEAMQEDYSQYLNDTYENEAIPHRGNRDMDLEWPDFVNWTEKNCLKFEDWIRETQEYCDLIPIVMKCFNCFREIKAL